MLGSKQSKRTIFWRQPISLAAVVVATAFAYQGASSQDLAPLEQALSNSGYKLYNPPRENWGPGFVFAGDVTNGKIRLTSESSAAL